MHKRAARLALPYPHARDRQAPALEGASLAGAGGAGLAVDSAVHARGASRTARDDLITDCADEPVAAPEAVRRPAGARFRHYASAARPREGALLAARACVAVHGPAPARALAHPEHARRAGAASAADGGAARAEAAPVWTCDALHLARRAALASRTATTALRAHRTRGRARVRVGAAAGAVRRAATGLRVHARATGAGVAGRAGHARLPGAAARLRADRSDAGVVGQAASIEAHSARCARHRKPTAVSVRWTDGAVVRRHVGVAEERWRVTRRSVRRRRRVARGRCVADRAAVARDRRRRILAAVADRHRRGAAASDEHERQEYPWKRVHRPWLPAPQWHAPCAHV
jgi:hypothetical protein